MSRSRALLVALGLAAVGIAVSAVPASAHDPIILTAAQTTPETGPRLLDGTISFALYGTVGEPGATRGFRVRFRSGETFVLSALVPDRPPEQLLGIEEVPRISVRTPSGEVLDLEPGPITTFAEPFTKTDYRRYLEWSAPTEVGEYGVTVTGVVPARFTVSVGTKEQFGTPVEDVPNRAEGVGGVLAWYRSPPPSVAPGTTAATRPAAAEEDSSSGGGGLGRVLIGVLGILVVGAGVAFAVRRRRRLRNDQISDRDPRH